MPSRAQKDAPHGDASAEAELSARSTEFFEQGIKAFKKEQLLNSAEMGYLQKKPSTHHKPGEIKKQKVSTSLFAKWKPRYFLIGAQSTALEYYENEADAAGGIDRLGMVDLRDAEFFLHKTTKDKRGEVFFDFTVVAQERGLQLRANSEEEYNRWKSAFKVRCKEVNESRVTVCSTRYSLGSKKAAPKKQSPASQRKKVKVQFAKGRYSEYIYIC